MPTANIENLTSLDVYNKNIADLTGIEDFTALSELRCYQNQLTSLDVSANTSLTYLNCRSNQLTSLDVSANTSLTELFCVSNQLTSLDVSVNTSLTDLFCYSNQLTSLDISTNTSLNHLSCHSNQLTSLDVRNGNNTNFTVFYSENNPNLTCIFVDDAAYSTTNWTNIDAASTFVETQAGCDALTATTYVPDDNFEQALIDLGYDSGALDDYVPTANIENLTSLDVSNKNIADLTGIEDFTSLTDLRCYQNQLTSLDVSTNTSLTFLNCFSNQLTSLDVSANTNLEYLYCHTNLITSLDVSTNTALTDLFCYSNQLTSLDVSTNTSLTNLRCNSNQLTSLDVRNGNNANFTYFNASDNPNLTCIFVDDAAYSTTNWTDIDAASTFVETQADCDALGIDDVINSAFMIYPNPVKDNLIIKTNLDILSIEIVDMYGKLIRIVHPSSNTISLGLVPTGVYSIRINTLKGVSVHKIIKK